jgi:hypothetical protein
MLNTCIVANSMNRTTFVVKEIRHQLAASS